ncbi:Dynll2 [Symbiodinium natans]|uniref:Dynll2 protein n=1 Tax=Symbiodinium natans TaxID=878477 RepID=A0A812IHP8_9DINO|nr:Dynll2 [Symbiodinium natans]
MFEDQKLASSKPISVRHWRHTLAVASGHRPPAPGGADPEATAAIATEDPNGLDNFADVRAASGVELDEIRRVASANNAFVRPFVVDKSNVVPMSGADLLQQNKYRSLPNSRMDLGAGHEEQVLTLVPPLAAPAESKIWLVASAGQFCVVNPLRGHVDLCLPGSKHGGVEGCIFFVPAALVQALRTVVQWEHDLDVLTCGVGTRASKHRRTNAALPDLQACLVAAAVRVAPLQSRAPHGAAPCWPSKPGTTVANAGTHSGRALCCDATLVSPLSRNGQLQGRAAEQNGAALAAAERNAKPRIREARPKDITLLVAKRPGVAKSLLAEELALATGEKPCVLQLHRDTRAGDLTSRGGVVKKQALDGGRGEAVSYVAEPGGVLTADVCVLDDVTRAPGEVLSRRAQPCLQLHLEISVIKNADMAEDMQQDAIDCATQALEKYNIEKDIAAFIKKEFDKKYNPTWHCVVGRNFGSYVTHETKHFIYFYLGQVAILVFKSG